MSRSTITLEVSTPEETARLASRFAPFLRAGDTLLLNGGIGAGKTHFARALISCILPVPEEIPSPTFTLVQTYQTDDFDIWHFDLYRLSGPDETLELGLDEALETSLCLIEWPDRLANLTPQNALGVTLTTGAEEDRRVIIFEWTAPRWASVLLATKILT